MKLKLFKSLLSLSFVVCTLSSLNVSATDSEYTTTEIPDEMQPYSEIVFTSDNTYEIVKGGHVEVKSEIDYEVPDYLKNANEQYAVTEIIKPAEGMIVTYASDGLIFDIVYPEGYEVESTQLNTPSTRGAILPDNLVLLASWGSYPNKLYYDSSTKKIYGAGRATTFSNTIGQGNHTLVKGDVATKLAYDNCQLGLTVSVTTLNSSGKNTTVSMKKWDVGAMPDAVLDIWKTGVQYWGYTWNSLFSMPHGVDYSHSNIDVNGKPIY